MAEHAGGIFCPFVLCRIRIHDNLLYDDCICPGQPEADPEDTDRVDCHFLCFPDGCRADGLFFLHGLLDAVCLRRSLRARRRRDRRRTEPLCRNALSIQRDELPALLLRGRRDDQPGYYGSRAPLRPLEPGLPLDGFPPVRHPDRVPVLPPALEQQQQTRRAG